MTVSTTPANISSRPETTAGCAVYEDSKSYGSQETGATGKRRHKRRLSGSAKQRGTNDLREWFCAQTLSPITHTYTPARGAHAWIHTQLPTPQSCDYGDRLVVTLGSESADCGNPIPYSTAHYVDMPVISYPQVDSQSLYTVTMVDPDAPSASDPLWPRCATTSSGTSTVLSSKEAASTGTSTRS